LDFCCISLGLCVEIDGDEHASKTARDAARTRLLNSRGIRVIRFTNRDVWGNLDGVREAIALELLQRLQDLTPTRRAKRAELPLSGGGMEHA